MNDEKPKATSFYVFPTLYQMLRIKLIANGVTVSDWLRQKMLEEVVIDEPKEANNTNMEKNI